MGGEGEELKLEGKDGLQMLEELQKAVVEGILQRRVQGKKGVEGHLRSFKDWSGLQRWLESREEEDTVFREPKQSCRLLRKRSLAVMYNKEQEGWIRRTAMIRECGRRAQQHRKCYSRAREHGWSSSMRKLRAAQRRGGSVVHEAFKIARARGKGSSMSRLVEVWDGEELVSGPWVKEVVHKICTGINRAKEAFVDSVQWWAGKVWGQSKQQEQQEERSRMDRAWQACTFQRFKELIMSRAKNKGVGVDRWSLRLAQEAGDQVMQLQYGWVMECMDRADMADSYREWVAILLNKPGEDSRKFQRRRDIWLTCHGAKVIALIMQEEYERLAGVEGSISQGGWERGRGAPEMTLTLRAQEEEAVQLGREVYRGYIDLGTFFMSVVREVAAAVEQHLGVCPKTHAVMQVLQGEVHGMYETAYGLTDSVDMEAGICQGDVNAPNRSKNLMKLKQRAVSALVEGYRFMGCAEETPQVWFADDGSLITSSWAWLQAGFDVAWMVARITGSDIGIKEDGSKTAWQVVNGCEWQEREYRQIVMPDGRVVPRVSQYKHLGTVLTSKGGVEAQRDKVYGKLKQVLQVISKLEISAEKYIEMTDVIIEGVLGFYGRSTPMSWEFCEKVERVRRQCMVLRGSRRRGEGTCEVYAKQEAGGLGACHAY